MTSSTITAPATPADFAVGDLVRVDGDEPGRAPWRITAIVTDDPQHDGPYALLEDTADGGRSWSALRILRPVCPIVWCAGHLGTGAEITHISLESRIVTASPYQADERFEIYVSTEQVDGAQVAAVRLAGAQDNPMHALQAIQVGSALISAAFAALTGSEVVR